MARHYKAQGAGLLESFEGLYKRYGYFRNIQISVTYPSAEPKIKTHPFAQVADVCEVDAALATLGHAVKEMLG